MIRSRILPTFLAGIGLSLVGCFSDRAGESIAGPSGAEGAMAARTASVNFTNLGFSAYDISVGSDGTLIRLNTPDIGGGNHAIQRWLGGTSFQTLPGSAAQLSVPVGGQFMAIKADNSLWQVINNNWTAMGSAMDVTSKTQSYRLNTTAAPTGGYTISKREGNSWNVITGSGHRIAVAPNGDLWAINYSAGYSIWRRPAGSSSWTQVIGWATEITISFDGTVYVLGSQQIDGGNRIYKYLPGTNSWQGINGAGVKIAGGVGKSLYVVSNNNSTVWYSVDPPNQ